MAGPQHHPRGLIFGPRVRRHGGLALALVGALVGAGCDETQATAAPSGSARAASPAAPARATASAASSTSARAALAAPPSPAPAVPSSSSTGAASTEGPCPPEMALVGEACVDRWEAHLVDVTDEPHRPHPHHRRPEEGRRYEARSAPGVWPQSYVNRHEAAAACREAGKRLCRWIEWRRACQGPKWYRYPYGNGGKNRTCNTGKDHLMTRFFGADPRRWEQADFNDPRLAQEPGYLARTGAFEGCVSPDGVYDMYGNLHEWVADPVTTSFMRKLKREGVPRQKQPWTPGNAMFLGGFFSTLAEHGPGCHFTTAAHGPAFHDYSTGFRCCADVAR